MVKIRGILNARKINVLAREQGQSYIKSNFQFFRLSVCGAMTRFSSRNTSQLRHNDGLGICFATESIAQLSHRPEDRFDRFLHSWKKRDRRKILLQIFQALEEYFLKTLLGKSLPHWAGRLLTVDNYLGQQSSDQSADNQKVFLQLLRIDLKRNQFARDTFAWPQSRFAISLVDSREK